jgi:hypothetical protein
MATSYTATEPSLLRGNGSALTGISLEGDLGAEFRADKLASQYLPPLRWRDVVSQYIDEHLPGVHEKLIIQAIQHLARKFSSPAEFPQLMQELQADGARVTLSTAIVFQKT